MKTVYDNVWVEVEDGNVKCFYYNVIRELCCAESDSIFTTKSGKYFIDNQWVSHKVWQKTFDSIHLNLHFIDRKFKRGFEKE